MGFGSEFNINYGPNGMTKFLDYITISSPFAAYGAHITINNQQTAESVKVIKIECGAGNCAGATFEFIGADLVILNAKNMEDAVLDARSFNITTPSIAIWCRPH